MPRSDRRRSDPSRLEHLSSKALDDYLKEIEDLTPEELKDQNIQTLDDANLTRLKSSNYTKLGDLSRLIGKYDK